MTAVNVSAVRFNEDNTVDFDFGSSDGKSFQNRATCISDCANNIVEALKWLLIARAIGLSPGLVSDLITGTTLELSPDSVNNPISFSSGE